MKLIFIDTETTGLTLDRCEVWEIGLIARTDEGDVEYGWQIRPNLATAEPNGLRIGRFYERLHLELRSPAADHTGAWVFAHPHLYHEGVYRHRGEMAAELADLLDGAYLVGAVPWFDERFLDKHLRAEGQALTSHYHLIDVETLAAGQRRLPPPWNFDTILAAYGLAYDENDRHTALGDARMVRDLYDAVMVEGTSA